jgi:Rieske Fe-S protein
MITNKLYEECLNEALTIQQEFIRQNPGVVESLPPGWLRRQLKKRNMYKEQVKGLKFEIEDLFDQIRLKQKQINEIHASCQHAWTEPKLITQKVGFDCGSYGGNYDSRHWERECSLCGKVDTTYREALMPVPDFENQDGKITVIF